MYSAFYAMLDLQSDRLTGFCLLRVRGLSYHVVSVLTLGRREYFAGYPAHPVGLYPCLAERGCMLANRPARQTCSASQWTPCLVGLAPTVAGSRSTWKLILLRLAFWWVWQ